MDEILKTIKKLGKKLPKFPDGRIDYSNSDFAPIVAVFVKHKDKILLVKRSKKVGNYREKWNAITGYFDELKPTREKALEELKEELGIKEKIILSINIGKSYKFTNMNKTWLVNPVLVELKRRPKIRLDWEHTEFKWVKQEEIVNFDAIPRLDKGLENALKKGI